jgi:hypothetical protein
MRNFTPSVSTPKISNMTSFNSIFLRAFSIVAICVISVSSVFSQDNKQPNYSKKQMQEIIRESRNTISFIENKGQWGGDVIGVGHSNIGGMVVKRDMLYFLSQAPGEAHEEHEAEEEEEEHETFEVHGWAIMLDGYNPQATVTKRNELTTKHNYFLGSNPSFYASDAKTFGEFQLNNIYEGIDLRIYSQDKQLLEFDWMVNAGADFNKIKMRFKGNDGLRIDEKGNLSVKLHFQEVKLDIPEAYQVIDGKKVPVEMAFEVENDMATFKALSQIDNKYPLVIDPSLKWGTFFDNGNDSFDEYLFAVQVDNQGNVFCGGATNMAITTGAGNYINPASLFGYDNSYAGSVDGIIYKLNSSGTAILAITYYGGTGADEVYGLGLSPDNSVLYACGTTAGDVPVTGTLATAFDNSRTSNDGWVAVFNASSMNTLQYATYLGGAGTGTGEEMVTIRGLSNNSFVVGGTVTAALPTSGPNYISSAYDASYSNGEEMYIAKFTSFNTLAFGTYVGGNGDDQLNDLTVFSDGAFAFTGSTASSTATFPGLINAASSGVDGDLDGVIGVIPANGGTFSMLSRIGGTNDDEFYGISIGAFDTLFVTGFVGSGFPLGVGASATTRFDITHNGGQDGFIGKLPRTGKPGAADPWAATFFGGSGNDRGNTLRNYTPYALMVFGETGSGTGSFPVKNLADGGTFYDATFNGGTWDIFWFVLGSDLVTHYYATYVGGSANDYLGQTGTPHGSNHFVVEGDSLVCLGTTTHSTTLEPTVLGPAGVFDIANSTGGDDKHLIFKWRIGILLNFDYGDAPLAYGNPNHVIFNSLKLGTANIDREDFPFYSNRANGDDTNGTTPDDEEAIPGTQLLLQDSATSYSFSVPVTNTTGATTTAMAWIDFNGNLAFDNAEVDTVRLANGATTANFNWSGFSVNFSADDTTYVRLRITSDPGFNVANPSPNANASSGEVEDHLVIIYHCVDLTGANITTQSPTNCVTPNGSITIANSNLLPNVAYTVYYSYNGGAPQGPFNLTTQNNGTLVIPNLNAGSYTTMQIFHPTNPLCGDTLVGPLVLIDPSTPPPGSVTASPNPVCVGGSLTLTATGSNLVWTFPGGGTANNSPVVRSPVTLAMAGVYSVTQTVNGCQSNPATVNVVVNPLPVIGSATGVGPTTCGGSNGTITLGGLTANTTYAVLYSRNTVSIGTPINITSNASGQVIITGLNAGSYSNFSVSLSGCTSAVFAGPVVLSDPANPAAPTSLTANTPLCSGQTLNLSASGNATAKFRWTGPASFLDSCFNTGCTVSRVNATTAMSGVYSVVQVVNNCTSSAATVSVTVNQTPGIANAVGTSPTTCNGTNGFITVSGLANNTTYTVNYSRNGVPATPVSRTTNGSGVLTIINLNSANYTNITVSVNGCPSAPFLGPILLVDPAAPSAPTAVSATPNPICTGNTVQFNATGQALAIWSWTGPQTFVSALEDPTRSITATNMAGSYCVTQSVAGCVSPQACVTLVVNATPTYTTVVGTGPTTCSGSDGFITISGLLNNTNYSFSYTRNGTAQSSSGTSNGSGQLVIPGLSAASYAAITVTVNGCASAPFAGPILLTDPSTPSAPTSVSASPNPICTGNTLTLSATGSGLVWTYPDGGGASGSPVTRTNVTTAMAGVYSVTQTVANCVSPPATVSVTVNPTPSIASAVGTDPTTCSGTNGFITVSGLAANTTYTVNYFRNLSAAAPVSRTTNGSGVLTIINLNAGSYTNITVSVLGCTSAPFAGPVILSDPATPSAPTLVSANPNPACVGNTVQFNATGTAGAIWAWTGPQTFTSSLEDPTRNITATNMAGSYCVTQTVFGCTSPQTCVTLNVNPTPIITTATGSNPTTCNGFEGSITLSGLANNSTYNVTYSRNSVGQGPFNFTTNGTGQLTIPGLNAGNYTNFIVTINGCPSSTFAGPVLLIDPSIPGAPTNLSASPNPVCTGGTLTLTATGANLNWTFPNGGGTALGSPVVRTPVTVAMAGTYSVTQTVAGCTSLPATVSVTVNQTPIITTTSSTNPTTCGGSDGTITLGVLNPNTIYSVSYLRNGSSVGPVNFTSNGAGNLVITGLNQASYSSITLTLSGCTSSPVLGPIVLNDPAIPSPPTSVAANPNPICSGNTLTLSAIGSSLAWTYPDGPTASGSPVVRNNVTTAMAGVYSVTQTVFGCTSAPATVSVTINQTPSITAALGTDPTTCGGSNGSVTLSGLVSSSLYQVSYTRNGTPQGPFAFSTNGSGQLTITGLNAGSYAAFTVTINGCTSPSFAGPVVLADPSNPSAPTNVSASPNPVCTGASLTLSATGSNLSWQFPDGPTATGSPIVRTNVGIAMAGVYSVTQTVAGCVSPPATVTVVVNVTPSITTAVGANPSTCGGAQGSVTLSGLIAGQTYTVNFSLNGTPQAPRSIVANGSGQVVITGLTAGNYSNFTVALAGCTSGAFGGPVTLTDPVNPPAPVLTSNSPRCYGDTLKIFASSIPGATYGWTGPSGFTANTQNIARALAIPAMSGVYTVTDTVSGCVSAPASITVTVTSCPPVAVDDVYSTPEDVTLTIPASGVLSNDNDPANPQQPLTVTGTIGGSGPSNGSLTLNANGSFTYIPNSNFTGTDNFCYRVCDNEVPQACDTACVTINVTPTNDPPVVRDTVITTPEDVPFTVCLPIADPESASQTHILFGTYCGPNSGVITGTSVNNTSNPHVVCVGYLPTSNFNGSDSICVIICDNGSPVLCDTAKIRITVTPVNDPPIAIDNFYTTNEDVTLTTSSVTGVRNNDNDAADGNPVTSLTVTTSPLSGPSNGTLTLNANGSFTYTPAVNFNGVDSFVYRVCDNGTPLPSLCDTAVAYITVQDANDPPVVRDTVVTTPEDVPITVCLPIADPESATQTHFVSEVFCGPSNGTITSSIVNNLSLPHTVCITYLPSANYNGLDSICVVICDNGSPTGCDTAKINITVTPVNDKPIAVDDYYVSCVDTAVTKNVLVNDSDIDGPNVTVQGTVFGAGPFFGTLTTLQPLGNFTYTPTPGFIGMDSFAYIICDGGSPNRCDTGVVVLDYRCVNVPPIAGNDIFSTPEDQTLNASVSGNDSDPDGVVLNYNTTPLVSTANGTLTLNANGTFTYVPATNYFGPDSFVYAVCDAGVPVKCDTATVYITVTPVNDKPFIPDTTITTSEDTTISICIPITEIDAIDLHVAAVGCFPGNGALSALSVDNVSNPHAVCVTYTPATNFGGVDSFCLIVCDNGVPTRCDTGVVYVNVNPVNDPPVAQNDNYTTNEDQTLTITAPGVLNNDNDVDGPTEIATVVTTTANGSLTLNANGSFTYTPLPNFTGLDSFVYSDCDGGTPNLCDTATAYITVIPVNDPPVVPNVTVTIPEDTTVVTICVPITDPENATQFHFTTPCGGPLLGSATNSVNNLSHVLCVSYTPTANANGTDSLCLIVCDNGIPSLCDTTTFTIVITPKNDPPVAFNDNYTTTEDVVLTIPVGTGVRANDNDAADGNPVTSLTVTATPLTGPSNGTLAGGVIGGNGSFTYTPGANFSGLDSFVYVVCDNGTPLPSLCDTATAYITVTGINDPPFIPDTSVTTCEDCPVNICIPFTDADVSDVHSYAVLCNATNGTVSNVSINNITDLLCLTYVGNQNFNGSDSICIVVCDNGIPTRCDTTKITITVTPVNDPPVAINDNYSTVEDVTIVIPVATGVRANDNDAADSNPNSSLTITTTPICGPVTGSVTLNANGSFTYVPLAGFSGIDSFCYVVCDAGSPLPSLCDTGVAFINIGSVNDPPVVNDTVVTTCEDCPITVCIPFTDEEASDVHSIAVLCNPLHGSLSNVTVSDITDQICFTYTGVINYNGADSLCIVICDNGTPSRCDTSTIRITITPVNDPPIAINDNYSTQEDVTLNIPVGTGVRSNDNDNADGNPVTSLTVNPVTVSGPSNGTLTLNTNGSFIYVPTTNFVGADTFYYSVCDAGTPPPSLCDTAMVVINVSSVNDPPFIPDTTITTCEDCPVTLCIPFADADVTDLHSFAQLCNPVNGAVTNVTLSNITDQLCFTYTGTLNFNGADSLCFVVCDNGIPSRCDTATIRITVTPVNDPPVALNDNYSTTEDVVLTVPVGTGVRANDNDNADGNPVTSLTVTATTLSGPIEWNSFRRCIERQRFVYLYS